MYFYQELVEIESFRKGANNTKDNRLYSSGGVAAFN